jgi:hypothetical protein
VKLLITRLSSVSCVSPDIFLNICSPPALWEAYVEPLQSSGLILDIWRRTGHTWCLVINVIGSQKI